MGKIKNFFVQMPYLCGSSNADRFSDLIKYQYECELKDKNSVYAKNSLDSINPINRLETAFIFNGYPDKIEYCKKLAELILLLHYRKEHKEEQWETRITSLTGELQSLESDNKDISEVLSIEDALVLGWEG